MMNISEIRLRKYWAPQNFHQEMMSFMDEIRRNQCIGHTDPSEWPAKSSDMTSISVGRCQRKLSADAGFPSDNFPVLMDMLKGTYLYDKKSWRYLTEHLTILRALQRATRSTPSPQNVIFIAVKQKKRWSC
jgi:hypothetical protein